jgi:hypothetical protein
MKVFQLQKIKVFFETKVKKKKGNLELELLQH